MQKISQLWLLIKYEAGQEEPFHFELKSEKGSFFVCILTKKYVIEKNYHIVYSTTS